MGLLDVQINSVVVFIWCDLAWCSCSFNVWLTCLVHVDGEFCCFSVGLVCMMLTMGCWFAVGCVEVLVLFVSVDC